MSWSVSKCIANIRYCDATLKVLNEDMEKLNKLEPILKNLSEKISTGKAQIDDSLTTLEGGLSGNTFRIHSARYGVLKTKVNTTRDLVADSLTTVQDKKQYITKRISEVEANKRLWENRKRIAEQEEGGFS